MHVSLGREKTSCCLPVRRSSSISLGCSCECMCCRTNSIMSRLHEKGRRDTRRTGFPSPLPTFGPLEVSFDAIFKLSDEVWLATRPSRKRGEPYVSDGECVMILSSPELSTKEEQRPASIHVYVYQKDTDDCLASLTRRGTPPRPQ